MGKPSFFKIVFLYYWESKYPEIHAHSIPHTYVSPPPAAEATWVFSLVFFLHFPHFLHAWKPVFVLLSEWEKENHNFAVYRGRFCSCNAQKNFVKSNCSPRVDFPICNFVFGCQTFVFIPNIFILLLCAPLFLSERIRSGRGP